MSAESWLPVAVDIYDTTLRDGSQQEGMSLTVDDKLRVAEQLDHLGVAYIEGGWPGANPKDEEFFRRAAKELQLKSATLVAFGSTRRSGVEPGRDETLKHLVDAGHVGDERVVATAEGNGPVNALDAALRLAIEPHFRELRNVHLTDYRVRVLDTAKGTGAVTRVLVDTADAEGNWSTIGVSENIIEASWQALVDAVVFGFIRAAESEPEAIAARPGEAQVADAAPATIESLR